MANKSERIQSLILKNVSEIIQFELKNKSVGFVTVSGVDVTHDLSYSKIYVSFLGRGSNMARLEALNKTKGFIRSELARRMDTYKVPELIFVLDDTFERAQKLDASLEREKKALENMKKKK